VKYFLEWLEKGSNQEFVVVMTLIFGLGLLIVLAGLSGSCS
jgi:hypothetical protein